MTLRAMIIVLVAALTAIGISTIFSYSSSTGLSSSSSSVMNGTNSTTTTRVNSSILIGSQCVMAGEPLYPAVKLISLQSFVNNLQGTYQVTVNETAGIVIVHNPSGGGIGAINSSTISFRIVPC